MPDDGISLPTVPKRSQPPKAPAKNTRGDRSIAYRIFSYVLDHPNGVTCPRVEKSLGISRSSASARLTELVRAGCLRIEHTAGYAIYRPSDDPSYTKYVRFCKNDRVERLNRTLTHDPPKESELPAHVVPLVHAALTYANRTTSEGFMVALCRLGAAADEFARHHPTDGPGLDVAASVYGERADSTGVTPG